MTHEVDADIDSWRTPVRIGTWVYQQLRESIISGELQPGTRLAVPSLARKFNVSRSPVRDAVLQLVRDGLAREEFNRGAVVALPDSAFLVSLYQAREALEGMAARLAVKNLTNESYDKLLGILREHSQIDPTDFRQHALLDAAFHREIRVLSQSPVLSKMLDEIQGQVMVAMRSTNLSGGLDKAVSDHWKIFQALAGGDPDECEAAARAHIARLTRLLKERNSAES